MSKLEDLLEEHTDEKVYESLSKAAAEAEAYVRRVFSGNTSVTQQFKNGALEMLHFFQGYAEKYNPAPWSGKEE